MMQNSANFVLSVVVFCRLLVTFRLPYCGTPASILW